MLRLSRDDPPFVSPSCGPPCPLLRPARLPTSRRRRPPTGRKGRTDCHCSATSNIRPASSISTTSIRRRRKGAPYAWSRSALSTTSTRWSPGLRACSLRLPARFCDTLMVPSLDEVVDPLRADRGSGQSSPGFCVHLLSLARRRPPPRRQADYGRGRDLFLRGLQEKQSPSSAPFTATSRRSSRAASARSLSPSTLPAIGKCR